MFDRRRLTSAVVPLVLVVVASVFPRINHIDKSIWTAEAWVANSVLTDSYRQMFHYDAWLQTTPPLFLVLVRQTVHVAGLSVYTLRAVPFVLGVVSVGLIAWLGALILRTPYATLVTALVAISPPAVVLSKEVKQYSGDVAGACMVLMAAWCYHERPDRRRYLWLLAAMSTALFLSYPAVCFLPVVGWALISADTIDRSRAGAARPWITRFGIFVTIALAICAVNEFAFIRPNSSPGLSTYWQGGFPPSEGIRSLVRYYTVNFAGMGIYYYLPIDAKDVLKDFAASRSADLAPALVLVLVATVAVTVISRNRSYRRALLMCVLPIVTLAGLNALRLYPVNSRRLTLFLLPCVALATGVLAQSFADAAAGVIPLLARRAAAVGLTSACVTGLIIAAATADGWSNYWFEDEDTQSALRYLATTIHTGDTVYVHASVRETVALHTRISGWAPPDLRYGRSGSACCPREPEPRFSSPAAARDYVLNDFDRTVGPPSRRLWLMFTARESHWAQLGRDEPALIQARLGTLGCEKMSEQRFGYEIVQGFTCRSDDAPAP